MAKNGDHVVPITDGKSIVGTIELTRIVRSIVNSFVLSFSLPCPHGGISFNSLG